MLRQIVRRAVERANLAVLAGRVVDAHERAAREHELIDHRRDLLRRQPGRVGRRTATTAHHRRPGGRPTPPRLCGGASGLALYRPRATRIVGSLGRRGLLEWHPVVRTHEHNRALHLRRQNGEVGLHLVGGRSQPLNAAATAAACVGRAACSRFNHRALRRDDLDGRSGHRALGGRRPGEHLEHEVVLHGGDDVPARLLIEPALAHRFSVLDDREVPGLEMAVPHAPPLHLIDRPLRRVLVVGRPGQPGAMHVGQVVHGLHDLRVAHALASDAGVHGRVDRLGRLLGRDDRHKADGDKRCEHLAQHEGTP